MYKSIPIKYSVYHNKSHPIFGDDITYVSLEDESGGPFIILEQPTCNEENIRLELDELKEIVKVSEKMIENYKKECYDS